MKFNFPKVTLDKDGTFGLTSKGNKYLPVSYHNRTANKRADKNLWSLKQNEQYYVFKIADEGEWECASNEGLFSILEYGKVVFGMLEERLAYFVRPANSGDPWHGYPIFSSEFIISEDLLDKWEENKVITKKLRIKIGKGHL